MLLNRVLPSCLQLLKVFPCSQVPWLCFITPGVELISSSSCRHISSSEGAQQSSADEQDLSPLLGPNVSHSTLVNSKVGSQ